MSRSTPNPKATRDDSDSSERSAAAEARRSSGGVRGRAREFARAWLKPLLLAVLIVAPFRSAVADWHDVPTGSMKPTVLEGDRIFVSKLAYELRFPLTGWKLAELGDPARGDVVVLRSPLDETRLLKRVVAVEGELVELVGGRLVIDGTPLRYERLPDAAHDGLPQPEGFPQVALREELAPGRSHDLLVTPRRRVPRSFGPVRVPAGHVLVLGDNRDNSADSRVFGFVARERIEGRVLGVLLSLHPRRLWPRWERTCTPLE
ncbi:MAG TPA: signal peptidase I [Planctomycetes bacterium]|nr:signal peptidase I [Planctomycetota bacterium]